MLTQPERCKAATGTSSPLYAVLYSWQPWRLSDLGRAKVQRNSTKIHPTHRQLFLFSKPSKHWYFLLWRGTQKTRVTESDLQQLEVTMEKGDKISSPDPIRYAGISDIHFKEYSNVNFRKYKMPGPAARYSFINKTHPD